MSYTTKKFKKKKSLGVRYNVNGISVSLNDRLLSVETNGTKTTN